MKVTVEVLEVMKDQSHPKLAAVAILGASWEGPVATSFVPRLFVMRKEV